MSKRRFKIKKAVLRGALYIGIASFTALMSDLSGFKNFNEITQVGSVVILINFILQGFIAWRAFIDQTMSEIKHNDDRDNPDYDNSVDK
jgi:uncharacterized membrane protein